MVSKGNHLELYVHLGHTELETLMYCLCHGVTCLYVCTNCQLCGCKSARDIFIHVSLKLFVHLNRTTDKSDSIVKEKQSRQITFKAELKIGLLY